VNEPRLPRSTTLLVAVFLVVLVTLAILLIDWKGTPASEHFVRQDGFLIWAVLLCMQSALWAVLAPPLWSAQGRLRADYPTDRGTDVRIYISVAVIVAFATAFSLLFSSVHPDPPLTRFHVKLSLIGAVGYGVVALAGIGIWRVEVACAGLSDHERKRQLTEYLRLRGDLRRFLNAAALLVGAVTLSIGGLRGAILASDARADFPPVDVLYYGAYYSVLLALIYLPVYAVFRGAGHRLLDALLPLPSDEKARWADFYADRKALEAVLEIDVVTTKGLQTALAIGAPLITSAIGLLLGAGS
jgi:hypothetical protein